MKPKVALVYDRVNTPYGGAELVLQALHQAFPEAPLFTSVYHSRAKWAQDFEIKTSFLQKLPFASKLHRYFVMLMPLAFEALDLSEFNIVISVTSAEAKGVLTKPNQLHISYILTPTRYLYSHRNHYEQTHWPLKWPIIGWISRRFFDYLTWWDRVAAYRPDKIITISQLVAERVKKHYQRQTDEIIYPPVDVNSLQPQEDLDQYQPYYLPDEYFVVISRLIPYKRIDLAIQACQRANKNLVIIGTGPQQAELEKLAGDDVFFLGNVSATQKQAILSKATALLMPGVEDFGITALEATMMNKPVVLHQNSGVSELLDKNVAHFLTKNSLTELTDIIKNFNPAKYKFTQTKKKLAEYAITDFAKRFKQTVFDFWQSKERTL